MADRVQSATILLGQAILGRTDPVAVAALTAWPSAHTATLAAALRRALGDGPLDPGDPDELGLRVVHQLVEDLRRPCRAVLTCTDLARGLTTDA